MQFYLFTEQTTLISNEKQLYNYSINCIYVIHFLVIFDLSIFIYMYLYLHVFAEKKPYNHVFELLAWQLLIQYFYYCDHKIIYVYDFKMYSLKYKKYTSALRRHIVYFSYNTITVK